MRDLEDWRAVVVACIGIHLRQVELDRLEEMRLLIYGSRSYSDTIAELAEDCGHEVVGRMDDDGRASHVLGRFLEVVELHRDCGIVMGIGYRDLPGRFAAWNRVIRTGLPTPALIHPCAYVARSASVGLGCVVMAGAVVDRKARLGEVSVVWPGACINHDAEVGCNSFISPNATVCGFAHVGAHSFIGAGAAIADHCQVPQSTRIKMLERYSLHRRQE